MGFGSATGRCMLSRVAPDLRLKPPPIANFDGVAPADAAASGMLSIGDSLVFWFSSPVAAP